MPLVKINGTLLYYKDCGQGTPLVCIHPPILTGANFIGQQAGLCDEFRVITFDVRGHGMSARSRVPVTYQLIAEDLIALLDHLRLGQVYLLGYSTGGGVAMETMLRYPERIAGTILVSAMSEASDLLLRSRIWLAMKLSSSSWNAARRLLALGITFGNASSISSFGKLFEQTTRGDRDNIQQYFQCSLTYSCTRALVGVKVPVLLLYGHKDRGFKRYAKLLYQGLPKRELHLLSGEKHQLPTKASNKLNAIIRQWLQRQNNRSRLDADVAASWAPLVAIGKSETTDEAQRN